MEAFQARGGELHYNARLKQILVGEDNGAAGFQLADGRVIEGDLYVSAASGVQNGLHIFNLSRCSPRGHIAAGNIVVAASFGLPLTKV